MSRAVPKLLDWMPEIRDSPSDWSIRYCARQVRPAQFGHIHFDPGEDRIPQDGSLHIRPRQVGAVQIAQRNWRR